MGIVSTRSMGCAFDDEAPTDSMLAMALPTTQRGALLIKRSVLRSITSPSISLLGALGRRAELLLARGQLGGQQLLHRSQGRFVRRCVVNDMCAPLNARIIVISLFTGTGVHNLAG